MDAIAGILGQLARSAEALTGWLSADRGFSKPRRLVSREQRDAADLILAASDLQDLREILDEVAIQPDLFSAGTAPFEPADLNRCAQAFEKLELDKPSLDAVIGPSATAKCEQGQKALRSLVMSMVGLAQAFGPAILQQYKSIEREPTMCASSGFSEMLYDHNIPIGARRVLLGVSRSIAAMIAIARAEERGERLDPWLASHLADAFANGFQTAHDAWVRLAAEIAQEDFEAIRESLASTREYKALVSRLYEQAAQHA